MYVDACASLELPYDEVRKRLLAVRLLSGRRMTVPLAGLAAGKGVDVELDCPGEGNGVVCVPIRWKPTWPSTAYPAFQGELELTGTNGGPAKLWLRGHYRPMLGTVSHPVDQALLRAVANDAVRQVLGTVASRFQHPASAA